MHQDAGRVEHRPQRASCAGERGQDVGDEAARLGLARADPLLGRGDHGFHQVAAKPSHRLLERGIGEEDVGAWDAPPGVGFSHGGGGRESNPPAAVPAAQRF